MSRVPRSGSNPSRLAGLVGELTERERERALHTSLRGRHEHMLLHTVGDGPPDFEAPDGALHIDRTNVRLYARVNGTWRYTALI